MNRLFQGEIVHERKERTSSHGFMYILRLRFHSALEKDLSEEGHFDICYGMLSFILMDGCRNKSLSLSALGCH